MEDNMDFHLISEKNIAQVESLWDYCFEKKDSYFFKELVNIVVTSFLNAISKNTV